MERVRKVLIETFRVVVIMLCEEFRCIESLRISRSSICNRGAKGKVEEKGAIVDWNNAVRPSDMGR